MAECALLPAMSKGASRRSNETDSLNCSINSAGPAVNRPPQVAWEGLAMTARADGRPLRGAMRFRTPRGTRLRACDDPVCPHRAPMWRQTLAALLWTATWVLGA